MGNDSSSNKNMYKEPLNATPEPPILKYGSLIDENQNSGGYVAHSALLDPSGHLSNDLNEVLDDTFNEFGSGLIMTKENVISYTKKCYPGLQEKENYIERADYILSRYGKPFKEFKQQLEQVLKTQNPSSTNSKHNNNEHINNSLKTNKYIIIETKSLSSNLNNLYDNQSQDEEESKISSNDNNNNKYFNRKIRKYSLIKVYEDKEIIEKTINLKSVNSNDLVLTKPQFFLIFRKMCIDKPMMARLELVQLGRNEFKSSRLADPNKSLDKLAHNVQSHRNRIIVSKEEKLRIKNAKSPEDCHIMIQQYIKKQKDPLDNTDDKNLFRKRRPIKCHPCCNYCCCCFVLCIKCCCDG